MDFNFWHAQKPLQQRVRRRAQAGQRPVIQTARDTGIRNQHRNL